jgi:hypothetical protein
MWVLNCRQWWKLIPSDRPMSRTGFSAFRFVYFVVAAVWLGCLMLVNVKWHGPVWAKVLLTLALVSITPDVNGPWRYQRYLAWWEKEHGPS